MTKSKSFRSWWPLWFPYPVSWLRTFATSFLAVGVGYSLMFFGFWGVLLTALTEHPLPLIGLVLAGLLVPFLVVAYTHHAIWGKPTARWPRWFPGPVSLKEGANALIVLFVATSIAGIALIPFIKCHFYTIGGEVEADCIPPTDEQFQFVATIWLIAAAYLYQYDYLIRRRRRRRVENRQARPTAAPLAPIFVDPVAAELNQLRADMGLNSVKNVKPKNKRD